MATFPIDTSCASSSHGWQIEELVRRIQIHGVDFDERFLAHLISDYFGRSHSAGIYLLSDAVQMYLRERPAGSGPKFQRDAFAALTSFIDAVGNLPIHELSHIHICKMRDALLERGLTASTVRKQTSFLNAEVRKAFQILDIDRLSLFRDLTIRGEGGDRRAIPVVTQAQLSEVRSHLLLASRRTYKLVALLQMNTGLRISEPVFARLDDCVLEHDIPHIWVRPNALSSRKNKSSIRAVPLVGVSLWAAKRLALQAQIAGSEWLVPDYARFNGNTSCSAAINQHLKAFDFRSHMFRHALVDRMKARNDIPLRLAESITGHSSKGSEYDNYGTVGYTLEQKLAVLKSIAIE